ncbi:hypothetical protein [Desulfuribacillus stibiiarsenatis]|uniref:hypothetical protein n=1 Tax=Desulfuribacillus stibiiarsenatis TaxID=1390249 RepID=UPI0015B5BC7E|nr:hypothetical protein [Desulfuribacillus stibiiarsenatis]
MDIGVYSTVTKTRTQDEWGNPQYFSITTIFDVSGTTISNMRNSSFNLKYLAYATNKYVSNLTGPTYNVIDNGRTGTVRYVGKLHFIGDPFGISNVTFYTEFYYNS